MKNKLVNKDKKTCRVNYVGEGESSWHKNSDVPSIGNDWCDRYRKSVPFSGEEFEYISDKPEEDY